MFGSFYTTVWDSSILLPVVTSESFTLCTECHSVSVLHFIYPCHYRRAVPSLGLLWMGCWEYFVHFLRGTIIHVSPKNKIAWYRYVQLQKILLNIFPKELYQSVLLPARNSVKRQKDMTLKDELPRTVGAQYVTEKSGEIITERMKRCSQSKNNTRLWMWLVMKVKSNAVKEQYCTGPWNVRAINQGKLEMFAISNRRWQEWTLTS